jgi:hypothetical protein
MSLVALVWGTAARFTFRVVPCSRTRSLSTVSYIGAERSDMQRCKPVTGCRPTEV